MSDKFNWPLMRENITISDRRAIAAFVLNTDRFTNGPEVEDFENRFSEYIGCRYAVMVNSGASANLLTMKALAIAGQKRVLVPCITWVSDIAAVVHAGLEPVFADVDPRTIGICWSKADRSCDVEFPTHCLGFDALSDYRPNYGAILVEDCCESIGAARRGIRIGAESPISNFSFYYGHHMSTIEGGMICTNDQGFYDEFRMLRSHGLTREMKNPPEQSPFVYHDFTFQYLAYNVRATELQAVLGKEQLKRLPANVIARTNNLTTFLGLLDGAKYRTDYAIEGSSNFALPLVLQDAESNLMRRVLVALDTFGIEYRRGTAGGGNQLRQPYARRRWGDFYRDFPEAEHIHKFGLYIGNYPGIELDNIERLCEALNAL